MSDTKTSNNRPARKSLAGQIDRLDGILDGLSEGLNETIAGAVKEAVGVAVKEAVQGLVGEVLSNPDALALLRAVLAQPAAATPEAPAGPDEPRGRPAPDNTSLGRPRGRPRSSWRACRSGVKRAGEMVTWVRRRAGAGLRAAVPFASGALAAASAYLASSRLAATAVRLRGWVVAPAVQAWRLLRALVAAHPLFGT